MTHTGAVTKSDFTNNLQELHLSTIVVNAIINGCSFAIALEWSEVVDLIVNELMDPDLNSSDLMRRVGAAIITTCFLCAFAAFMIWLNGTWRRTKKQAVVKIAEAIEYRRSEPSPSARKKDTRIVVRK